MPRKIKGPVKLQSVKKLPPPRYRSMQMCAPLVLINRLSHNSLCLKTRENVIKNFGRSVKGKCLPWPLPVPFLRLCKFGMVTHRGTEPCCFFHWQVDCTAALTCCAAQQTSMNIWPDRCVSGFEIRSPKGIHGINLGWGVNPRPVGGPKRPHPAS